MTSMLSIEITILTTMIILFGNINGDYGKPSLKNSSYFDQAVTLRMTCWSHSRQGLFLFYLSWEFINNMNIIQLRGVSREILTNI